MLIGVTPWRNPFTQRYFEPFSEDVDVGLAVTRGLRGGKGAVPFDKLRAIRLLGDDAHSPLSGLILDETDAGEQPLSSSASRGRPVDSLPPVESLVAERSGPSLPCGLKGEST